MMGWENSWQRYWEMQGHLQQLEKVGALKSQKIGKENLYLNVRLFELLALTGNSPSTVLPALASAIDGRRCAAFAGFGLTGRLQHLSATGQYKTAFCAD